MLPLKNTLEISIPRPEPHTLKYRCVNDHAIKISNVIKDNNGYVYFNDHEFIIKSYNIKPEWEESIFEEDKYYIIEIQYYKCLKCHNYCSGLDDLLDSLYEY